MEYLVYLERMEGMPAPEGRPSLNDLVNCVVADCAAGENYVKKISYPQHSLPLRPNSMTDVRAARAEEVRYRTIAMRLRSMFCIHVHKRVPVHCLNLFLGDERFLFLC